MGTSTPALTSPSWRENSGTACRPSSTAARPKRHRRAKHDFAFSRLIECGHCGSSIVGEIKKQRYVYYHCTGYRGKCGEPYVRQEVIEEKFSQMLGRLAFDDEVLAWVREALSQSHAEEKRDHEQAIARLRAEHDRLQSRIHAMYVDRLDGRIDGEFFDRMSTQWRAEQDRCLQDIERHSAADRSYLRRGHPRSRTREKRPETI